ncbi:MAG: fatty acid--CoA ligase family protein [Oligoflexia bacterium]|nr:fatty acid--CoA ligase family protein [Oligoflexia bacterium]
MICSPFVGAKDLRARALTLRSERFATELCWQEILDGIATEKQKLGKLPPGIAVLRAECDAVFLSRFLAFLELGKPAAIFAPDCTPQEFQVRRQLLGPAFELDRDGQLTWEDLSQPVRHHPETAVVLFTSGSTGAPKAVQLSRRNIEANTRAVIRSLDFDRATEQTLFLPLSYSYGLLGQVLPAFATGVPSLLLERFIDVRELLDAGEARGMWSGVPSHWEALLRLTRGQDGKCQGITHVVSAGAPMSVDLRKRLRERFPRATLYNNYGLTEASPRVLSFSSRDPAFFVEGVGYPVGDFSVKLTPEGELCVQGSQVMLGYLGDAPGTAEKIRDGWLHSGDGATLAANGLVTIHGRKDELFNIGGERTSPHEIAAALRDVPGVEDVAILIEDDPLYGAKILAFVVCGDSLAASGRAGLQAALASRLSPLKLPREYFRLTRLPRGANGKLLRAELAALKGSATRIT